MIDLEYIFVDSWKTVLSSFSSKKLLTSINSLKGGTKLSEIHVMITMEGDMDGHVFLSMDAQTGAVIASEMLGGVEITHMEEELITSAVSELCNMIMGNACSLISEDSCNVDITPPSILTPEEVTSLGHKPSLCISLLLEDTGSIDFDVIIHNH
jgi:chemotaxis protein CheX